MPYIGPPAPDRFVAPKAASVFSGDGSTTAFTLDHAVGSDEDILVSVDGVIQEPSVAYAVSNGTTLTFTGAPSSNSGNNIFVYYLFRTVGTVSHPSNNAFTATNGTLTGTLDVTGATTLSDDVTISDKIIHSGDTNTAIRFPSADTVTIETGGSERARVSSGGVITVGKTDQTANVVGAEIEGTGTIVSTRDGNTNMFLNRKTSYGDIIDFRYDNTNRGNIGIGSGNVLYVGGGDTFLSFFPSSDMIYPANDTGSGRDDAIDLGASGARFDDIYATNGTIQTSDRNEKQDIEELNDAEKRVAVVAKGLMRKFRWKSKVEIKGDNARTHFGIIAQDLQDAFKAEGLDASDYAMFISDTWTDDDGKEQTRLGVRYSELLAFIISAI